MTVGDVPLEGENAFIAPGEAEEGAREGGDALAEGSQRRPRSEMSEDQFTGASAAMVYVASSG